MVHGWLGGWFDVQLRVLHGWLGGWFRQANHVQHIERLSRGSVMLCATWYEGTAHLLSFDRVEIAFI